MLIKKILAILFMLSLIFISGLYLIKERKSKINSFEGIMAINPQEYQSLIDPDNSMLKPVLKKIKSVKEAYYFVRDFIDYFPMVADASVDFTLENRVGSCIGKAVLLASLYRALGVEDKDLRIVTGEIRLKNDFIEHAWVEIKINNCWYQQDTTNLIGKFDFDEFPDRLYSKSFCQKEGFCFNQTGFAVISQLNLMR